jgi:hypothetical protein
MFNDYSFFPTHLTRLRGVQYKQFSDLGYTAFSFASFRVDKRV